MPVFKAYDVRGKYPTEIDESLAERLGGAVVRFLKARRIAVGRDVRLSAPSIAAAVAKGAGCEVVDIGLCTTPMLYYAVGKLGLDGGVMVTASHNPPGDIGFKICREKAFPIGEKTGLKEIEAMAAEKAAGGSTIRTLSIQADYRTHLRRQIEAVPKMRIAVDNAHGAVGAHFDALFGDLPIDFVRLCWEPDGRFPTHEPNPLKDENVRDLQEAMKKTGADLGAAFDGDGDRCMFFGPGGVRIGCDLVTILIARSELRRHPGSAIVYDLRSSRVVPEEIRKAGGRPIRDRVGHSFIKETMKKNDAVFGGELSGHFYFREHYFADSGMMAFAKVLDLLGREKKPIDELLAPLRRTSATGEINFKVADKDALIRRLLETFPDGRIDKLDGITIEYDDWWFNVRASNTEPYLRLNLEANTPELLETKRSRLFAILGNPV
ncbi:MAG: phosphomannomutase/phosphoglucomutase [Planctomycetota bacterium]|nr:MAG: phosphomannomutase/phosphoglucomutase [Planctomycetota bacterium]